MAYVSLLSIGNPQATMDLIKVNLPNNDAISSIIGIYGGSGLAIVISLSYLFFKNIRYALQFLSLSWGFYATSRMITILVDGPLGSFGNKWIIIESFLFLVGVILLVFSLGKKPISA